MVYNTAEENISDAQIKTQIKAMNKDFRATNPDRTQTPTPWMGLVTDSRIKFKLVKTTRTKTSKTSFSFDDGVKRASTGGIAPLAFDTSDVFLGSRSVPELLPNATSVLSSSLTIPAGTTGGNYYLVARADGGAVVAETSENNNTKAVPVAVGPDLVVSALTAPSASGAGQTIGVTDTTKNQGAGSAAASATSFYLSVNTVLDTSDVLLGSRSVPALLPSATCVSSSSLTIPADTRAGGYYLIARADGGALVPETSESNNGRNAYITVSAP